MDILEDLLGDNNKKYPDLKYGFEFKSKFKLIDTRKGFHVVYTYLFKRGITKEDLIFLENDFLKKTIDVNDVSGLELSDFNTNKVYTAVFTLYYYTDDTFDLFLHHTVKG